MTNTQREGIQDWLDTAAGVYRVPVYLIEELQDKFNAGKDIELLIETINDDITAMFEFQKDLIDLKGVE